MMQGPLPEQKRMARERHKLVYQIQQWLEPPMIFLGLIWLLISIYELAVGERRGLMILSNLIWIFFGLEFLTRFAIAPDKWRFLKQNVLAILSLVLPAFRVLRMFRAFRLLSRARPSQVLRLARILTSTNRGLKSLRGVSRRLGVGYVILATICILFAGAAGMLAFERKVPNTGIENFGDALWWTAMMLTTSGSEYWPRTTEGRILCVFISVYAFAIFGYIAASVASLFVGVEKAGAKK
jgi:voltage-gated potassium channel